MFRLLSMLSLVAMICACGGGGSSDESKNETINIGDQNYAISPHSLRFVSYSGASYPPTQKITIKASSDQDEYPDVYHRINGSYPVIKAIEETYPDDRTLELEVSVVPVESLAGVGTYSANIHIDVPGGTLTIPVEYEITLPPPGDPALTSISPSITYTNQSREYVIRGSGFLRFSPENLPEIRIGDVVATNITLESDTAMTFTLPVMASGFYPVAISGAEVSFENNVSLEVIAPQTYPSTEIPTPGKKERILYEPSSSVIFLVNRENEEIERYQYNTDSGWTKSLLSIDNLRDAAITTDRKSLVALTRETVVTINIASGQFEIVNTAAIEEGISNYTEDFSHIVASNDNSVYLAGYDVFNYRPYEEEILMDDEVPFNNYFLIEPSLHSNQNGSKIYVIEDSITPKSFYILNTNTDQFEKKYDYPISSFGRVAIAEREKFFITKGTDIYDLDFNKLSSFVPAGYTSVLNREATIAYVVSSNGTSVTKYDLSNILTPIKVGSEYLMNNAAGATTRVMLTDDEQTLLVAGFDYLVIIDLTTSPF